MFPVSIEITRHERLPTPWECEYATGRFPGRDPNFLLVVYVVSWAELQPNLRLQPNLCRSPELSCRPDRSLRRQGSRSRTRRHAPTRLWRRR